ncbi:MAG: sulfurtransferase [Burkholderiaceae bacterium]|nr:sulfurtransferase [Burkholderiaceae bacterium]
MYTTLISAEELQSLLASEPPLTADGKPIMVFDCTFDLMNPDLGPQQFNAVHIAGAVYVNLDTNLSAKNDLAAASGGRHPLPSRETFAAWLGSVGFSNAHQAVVYDRNGANYCGRLWWMLKWAGHEAVAVLDGGLQAWEKLDGAVESSDPAAKASKPSKTKITPSNFTLTAELTALAAIDSVAKNVGKETQTIVDARNAPRFRGEVEPIDPVAGHIPGALNRPFTENIGPDGKFKPAEQLKAEFATLLAGRDPSTVVHHCGSGVSAVPNLLAMELAGLGRQALFAGSWSEWCSDPSRPVAQG